MQGLEGRRQAGPAAAAAAASVEERAGRTAERHIGGLGGIVEVLVRNGWT